jgi:hypothetical protein
VCTFKVQCNPLQIKIEFCFADTDIIVSVMSVSIPIEMVNDIIKKLEVSLSQKTLVKKEVVITEELRQQYIDLFIKTEKNQYYTDTT